MQITDSARRIFHAYLSILPVIVSALGLGVGHVDYNIYVPVWILHSCVMCLGAWITGVRFIRSDDQNKKRAAAIGLFFILPWILVSIFGGMGPPPFTITGWAELATEQQVRFSILILCGVLIAFGFSTLYEDLKSKGEGFYSRLGFTCIILAMPLFIITMAGWGALVTDAFRMITASSSKAIPDWLAPIRHTIEVIIIVWVALIYLATTLFAASIKKTGMLTAKACNVYMITSLAALVLSLAPPSSPEPIATISYLVGIPAITLVIPYLMGINLVRRISG